MKTMLTLVALLAAVLAGPCSAPAAEEDPGTICQLCGVDGAKSETEFILHREAAPDTHACCFNCARRLMKKLGVDVAQVTTLDYRTRKQVAAADAFYVLGSERIPKGSMVPFIFAFGSREHADAFKEKNGGEVLTFADILKILEADQSGMHGH